jgi:phage shock protein B
MHTVLILSIIFGGTVLALAVIGGTILLGIKILKGGLSPSSRRSQAEEAKMIQEIYEGLSKMEKRVEALETIILDQTRKDKAS